MSEKKIGKDLAKIFAQHSRTQICCRNRQLHSALKVCPVGTAYVRKTPSQWYITISIAFSGLGFCRNFCGLVEPVEVIHLIEALIQARRFVTTSHQCQQYAAGMYLLHCGICRGGYQRLHTSAINVRW